MTTPPCPEYIGWHFAADTLRDGTPLPKAGDTLRMDGPVRLCECGYHASERPLDALSYAPGLRVARVALRGDVQRDTDKAVATERHYITGYVDAWPAIDQWLRNHIVLPTRERAVVALRTAGLTAQADTLAAIADQSPYAEIQDAARAARAAWDAGAAWDAAGVAAWAAGAAAGAAARAAGAAAGAAWDAARVAAWAAGAAAGAAARAARVAAWAAGAAAGAARATECRKQNDALRDALLALFAA